jgi:hypothetical protein
VAKDSHNSSKPPSSEGPRRKARSQHQRSEKPTGGQPVHAGHSLMQVASPDEEVCHRPLVCTHCQQPLEGVAGQIKERHQVQAGASHADCAGGCLYWSTTAHRVDTWVVRDPRARGCTGSQAMKPFVRGGNQSNERTTHIRSGGRANILSAQRRAGWIWMLSIAF